MGLTGRVCRHVKQLMILPLPTPPLPGVLPPSLRAPQDIFLSKVNVVFVFLKKNNVWVRNTYWIFWKRTTSCF